MIDIDGDKAVEFYVPATFQFSTAAGRIERLLVGLFHERGELEVRRFSDTESPDFYIPAVYQFSVGPGRIERFLTRVFTEHGDVAAMPVPTEFVDHFYLPAANPDGYRRSVEQAPAPLVPASEIAPPKGKPGGN